MGGRAFVTSSQLNQSTYFKSEFGQTSLPSFETLAPFLDGAKGDYGVLSRIMVHRKHTQDHDIANPIASLFGKGTNLSDTSKENFQRVIFLSQLAQTLCIKTYLEELRRGGHTFGALIWQLNDVWAASSWGSLDYGGRWRALHHSLQAVFAPTVASVWVDGQTLRVYASHHGAASATPLRIEVNVTNVATGAVSSAKVFHASIAGTAVIAPLTTLPLGTIRASTEVVTTRVVGFDVSETVHLLLPPLQMAWVLTNAGTKPLSHTLT